MDLISDDRFNIYRLCWYLVSDVKVYELRGNDIFVCFKFSDCGGCSSSDIKYVLIIDKVCKDI